MSELIPVLIGTKGLAEGEVFPLGLDGELVVGRSRGCSVSFQRFRRFLSLPPGEQALRDSYNSAVSRRHLVLRSHGMLVTLENLSRGGSWCDDKPFSTTIEVDLSKKAVVLRLGQASETFQLALLDRTAVNALVAKLGSLRPPPAPLPGVPDPVEDPTPQQNLVPYTDALTPRPVHHPLTPPQRPHTPPPDLEQSRYL
jgi:hypothetical protein